jgi:signal transduction histidine kinase
VKIAVADTGIGIKREDQRSSSKIFVSSTALQPVNMAAPDWDWVSQETRAALGGTIQVSSEVGVGSVFSLLLPVKG